MFAWYFGCKKSMKTKVKSKMSIRFSVWQHFFLLVGSPLIHTLMLYRFKLFEYFSSPIHCHAAFRSVAFNIEFIQCGYGALGAPLASRIAPSAILLNSKFNCAAVIQVHSNFQCYKSTFLHCWCCYCCCCCCVQSQQMLICTKYYFSFPLPYVPQMALYELF